MYQEGGGKKIAENLKGKFHWTNSNRIFFKINYNFIFASVLTSFEIFFILRIENLFFILKKMCCEKWE